MKNILIFILGFVLTFLIFLAINVLAIQMMSDCGIMGALGLAGCADDISRAGFPLLVWEHGGFAYRDNFNAMALLTDVGFAFGVSLVVGFVSQWLGSRRTPKALA
jgi:ABC-type antimicrobial peptide transport system permease subunit